LLRLLNTVCAVTHQPISEAGMTFVALPSSIVSLEDRVERRKIRAEADARACLAAAQKSGLAHTTWCRASGVDGRSLRAWSINLARGAAGRRKTMSRASITKRVELVELNAATSAPTRSSARYTVRMGELGIEVGDDFDAGTLRRVVAALAC
jgi:hypothetical protein